MKSNWLAVVPQIVSALCCKWICPNAKSCSGTLLHTYCSWCCDLVTVTWTRPWRWIQPLCHRRRRQQRRRWRRIYRRKGSWRWRRTTAWWFSSSF